MPGSGETIAACERALASSAVSWRGALRDASVEPAGEPRGVADARAFRQRFHDPVVHRQLMPQARLASTWFDAFEQARVEALGGRWFAGAAHNIRAHRAARSASRASGAADTVPAPLRQALDGLCVLGAGEAGLGRDVGGDGREASGTVARPALRTVALADAPDRDELQALAHRVDDQLAFGREALAIIGRLLSSQEGDETSAAPAGGSKGEGEAEGAERSSPALPPVNEAAADEAEPASDAADDNDDDDNAATEPALHDDPAGEAQASLAPSDAAEGERSAADEAAWVVSDQGTLTASLAQPYRVYTTRFDRTLAPSALAEPAELNALRQRLDGYIDRQGQLVQRLANRLYRRLLARQRRAWQFDEPEGELDSARLSRLITDPLQPLVFRRELDGPFRDTAVTLLLDNSRSMLGRPILVAAACADILARTLERCGVAVEVLGFTTASLHGGEAAARWEHQGRPPTPGRISDLRHIVYKSASQPWRRARAGFGLMLKPELLNQNVDGEALQWAHGRLMRRPASRRLLLVISDGAPVDVSTLAANDEQYLAAHLHQVIAAIEARDEVQLLAIGIGHDVRSWYRRAVRIADARDLGNVLVSELTQLFEE